MNLGRCSPAAVSWRYIDAMRQDVRDAIERALRSLLQDDGYLYDCPIEEGFEYDARKLHEVCINHRLASHLERELLPVLSDHGTMYVDIEFNREGLNYKAITMDGEEQRVRPDIIIHNRRSGEEKLNFLVVECKKVGSPGGAIARDREKIEALMMDEKYTYQFGLQVVYGATPATATFFVKGDASIETETINYS